MGDTAIVEVYSALDSSEAYLIKGQLDDAGIKARVVNDILRVAGGDLPLGQSTAPRIWVHKNDEQQARQLIQELCSLRKGSSDGEDLASWVCPHCGQDVESNFALCWNCEHPRQ